MFLATYYKNKQQQTLKDINGRFKPTPILGTKLPPSNLWYLSTERNITRKKTTDTESWNIIHKRSGLRFLDSSNQLRGLCQRLKINTNQLVYTLERNSNKPPTH